MRLLAATAFALLCAACAATQKPGTSSSYEPVYGQPGKDVVWIATPQVVVDRMLDMARVGPRDFVLDLGSGDGRTVIAAAKRGARALGIEYDANLVEYSRRKARQEGVAGKAAFAKADLFDTDLSRATVITLFLREDLNLKLKPRILALRPGTRIASNTFTMGDWKEDERTELKGCAEFCTALLWIVPAKVEGSYWTALGEITFAQRYQFVTGSLRAGANTFPLEGRISGEEIAFTVAYPTGRKRFSATLKGETLELRQPGQRVNAGQVNARRKSSTLTGTAPSVPFTPYRRSIFAITPRSSETVPETFSVGVRSNAVSHTYFWSAPVSSTRALDPTR